MVFGGFLLGNGGFRSRLTLDGEIENDGFVSGPPVYRYRSGEGRLAVIG